MNEVLSLALPFFGLIFIGFACGKIRRLPPDGLAWLNFFIIYVALPALFFQLLSKTPIEQLANLSFVAATTFATYTAFTFALLAGILATKGNVRESAVIATIGSYSNVGYMGPGLTMAALGPAATVPTALIFCFDCTFFFTVTPLLMAIGGERHESMGGLFLTVVKRILLHPFIVATAAGIAAAAVGFQPPLFVEKMLNWLMGAAAPCALFTLGVTVALRPIREVPFELPLILVIKLVLHPLFVLVLLAYIGGFDKIWVETAVLMACLPPAMNAFVIAQQYNVYVERASTGVLIGTLLSVGTVTGFLYLVAQDLLPVTMFGR
jgi:hypothetical protein